MNPTRGVVRSNLFLFQKNAVVWDFGGQEIYQNKYLMNPESYFRLVSFFYYVIDIQDYYRIFSSTMYFMAVLLLIKKYSPDASLVFLFHKMDPDYDPSNRNLKERFLDKVEHHLQANNLSFKTYDTTIFDINSIKTAFS